LPVQGDIRTNSFDGRGILFPHRFLLPSAA